MVGERGGAQLPCCENCLSLLAQGLISGSNSSLTVVLAPTRGQRVAKEKRAVEHTLCSLSGS